MAEVLIGALGRSVRRDESHIVISGPAGSLGFWAGRGGLPQDKIDRIIRRHEHEAGEESARITLTAIRRNIPRRTGRTARTFEIRHVPGHVFDEWRVGSSDDNAIRLEDGTGIYGPRRRVIRPRNSKVLRFPNRATGGFRLDDTVRMRDGVPDRRARYVYTKTVRGQRPKRYLERTAREVQPLVIRLHKNAARSAASELRAR